MAARIERRDEVNRIVADWMGGLTADEVTARCEEYEVPCAPLYSIADIFEDPQYAARENLLRVQDPRVGEVVLPASVPRLSETPAQFKHAGPALGADSDDIYRSLLGLDDAALEDLRKAGVV
jgi:crotonobetainyl-CoA:carnitine CoA-transferase CaiB-like acyl-CoA transferase